MADFGAEVIKVEPVGTGDPLHYSLRDRDTAKSRAP